MALFAHIKQRLIALALSGLLAVGSHCVAGAPVLVSHDNNGNPGNAHSGLTMSQGFYTQPANDGAVLFVSQVALVDADTNQVHDLYEYGVDGTVRVRSLPQGMGTGPCMWGQADSSGTIGFVLRQAVDPTVWTFQYGVLTAIPDPLPFLKVNRLDFAGNGQVVVYAYAVDSESTAHIIRRNLTDSTEVTVTTGANASSSSPVISMSGTRIAFASAAYNLVAGDANGVDDIFLYDQGVNPAILTLVSPRFGSAGGYWPAQAPAISGDGQAVAFVSQDSNFVVSDTNGKADVFVVVSPFDPSERPTRISVSTAGTQADQDALDPKLSQTGRFVVFRSKAATLVPGAAGTATQVYLVDRDLGTIECVSRPTGDSEADADCVAPNVSPSGQYVTFVSAATNLAANVPAGKYQVYRVDRGRDWANHPPVASTLSFSMLRGQPVTFSLTATDVDGHTLTYTPTTLPAPAAGALKDRNGNAIVADQAYATGTFPWTFTPADAEVTSASFQFQASDGIANSAAADVRFLDGGSGTVERMSVTSTGSQGTGDSGGGYPFGGVAISGDGTAVVFASKANLSTEDADAGASDIYVRTPQAGTSTLLSWRSDIGTAEACLKPALSADGTAVSFVTQADAAIYRLHRPSDVGARLVSLADYPGGPAVSRDGSHLVYTFNSTVSVLNATGTVVEGFVAANGAAPAISADGQVIAFVSTATELVPGGNPGAVSCIFWKRIGVNEFFIVSQDNSRGLLSNATAPVLSVTGRFVAFLATGGDGQTHLYRRHVGTGDVLDLGAGASNPAISADGRFLYFVRGGQAYRYDTTAPAATQPVLLSHAPGGAAGDGSSGAGALSASGQYTAFASSSANLVSGDTNAKWDVFRADLGAPANTLPNPSLRDVAVNEDQALTGEPIAYTDAEGNDAEFELLSQPQHAKAGSFVVQDLKPGQAFPKFDYQPADHFYGSDSFAYRYGDVGGWSEPVTVTITVNEVNDPPALAAVANQAVNEGQTLDVALTATDLDTANPDAGHRDTLTLSVVSGPGSIQNGRWTYAPDFTVASKANSPLVQSVTLQVADGRGGTAQQTFAVTVTHVSHPPVLQVNGPLVLVGNATTGAITVSLLQVTDLDYANAAPPPANMLLTLLTAPATGNLTDKNNQLLVAGNTFSYGDLPLTFTCTGAPAFGVDSASFKATDTVEDAAGQESLPVTLDIVTGAQVQSLVLEQGWNLISFSLTPAFTDPPTLFTVNGQSLLSGPLWRWDAANRQFVQVQQAKAGEGYWMKSNQAITLPVPGNPVASGAIDVITGWNLVGPVGPGTAVACPANCQAWWWLPKSRAFTTTPDPLQQGGGYFLHVPDDGTATVDLWMAP